MGAISNKERRERLHRLLDTVYSQPKGVTSPALIAAACREWGITKRTAQEYVEVLIDSHLVKFDPPGGPLHCTTAGIEWLGEKGPLPDDDPDQLKLAPPPSPAPKQEDAT